MKAGGSRFGTMFNHIQIVMVSNYLLIADWGLLNTHAGVILPQLANGFGIFLLRQHLPVFPQALLDAARIDGASEITTLFLAAAVLRDAASGAGFAGGSWTQGLRAAGEALTRTCLRG